MTKKSPNIHAQRVELIVKCTEEDLVQVYEELLSLKLDKMTMTKLYRLSIKTILEEHTVSIVHLTAKVLK